MKKPEILAPAGSLQSVIAALNGGCDAIYIGGKSFSARAYGDNPSDDMLKDIILMCHLRGVKVFVAINTLYKESEINDVLEFVSRVYSYGVYGVITQDIGIADIIKRNYTHIKLSASTQMTIHSIEGARLMAELGYDRVVLARELSENEIKKIAALKNTETEIFIHGALCVSYSGRCLLSSFIGGRSGNRGRCAQPCRMEYSLIKNNSEIAKGYLLSPKDICDIDIIDKVAATGADSLKIEGRMKSPEYVYQTVSLYRKYIDGKYADTDKNDIKNITQIFNRGGSSSHGYFDAYSGKAMMSIYNPKGSGSEIGIVESYKNKKCRIRLYDNIIPGDGIEIWSRPHTGAGINKAASKGDIITLNIDGNIKRGDRVFRTLDKALNDSLKNKYAKIERKQKINIEIYARLNDNIRLEFTDHNISVKGDIIQKAENRPVTRADILSKIQKTGDTPFEFNVLNINIDDNIYIPISSVNNLRRNACEMLENKLRSALEREEINVRYEAPAPAKASKPVITVMIRTDEQFKAAVDSKAEIIYCGILDEKYAYIAQNAGKRLYYALPHISREGCDKYIKSLDNTPCGGYIVRSYGNINTSKEIITDYTLNVTNTLSVNKLRKIYGSNIVTLSPELNTRELKAIADNNCEIIVYGRLPLMTTHQCPAGLYEGGKKGAKYCKLKNSSDIYYLKDRKNIKFPVVRDCSNCIAYILSSEPIDALSIYDDILSIGAGYLRIELTLEDYDRSVNIINSYIENKNISDRKSYLGHYHRGVL